MISIEQGRTLTAAVAAVLLVAAPAASAWAQSSGSLRQIVSAREQRLAQQQKTKAKPILGVASVVLGGLAANECQKRGGGDLCGVLGVAVVYGSYMLGDKIGKMLKEGDQRKVLAAASDSLRTGEPTTLALPGSSATAEIVPVGNPVTKEADVDVFYDSASVQSLTDIDVIAEPYMAKKAVDMRGAPSTTAPVVRRLNPNAPIFVAGRVDSKPWYMISQKIVDGDTSAMMIVGYVSAEQLTPAPKAPTLAGGPMPSTLAEGKLKASLKCDEIDMTVRNEKGETAKSKSVKCRGPEGQLLSA